MLLQKFDISHSREMSRAHLCLFRDFAAGQTHDAAVALYQFT